jgi:hypothetical protein
MARDYQEIDRVVQSCLEAVESGGESIDSVIARYPDLEETIRPPLEAAIWLQARKSYFDPRPEFVSESRQRLIAQIQRGSEVQVQTRGSSLRDFFAVFARRERVLQFALALLLVIFLVVGTGSVALAARGALPGQSLYSVKLAQERLRLALSFTQAGDARLHAEFAQERLVEVQELVLERRYELLDETLARYEQEVAQAVFLTREVAEDDASQALALADQMDENLTRQVVLLSLLSERVPQETEAEISHALELAEQGILTVEVIKNQLIEPGTPTTTPTPTTPISTSTRMPTQTPLPTQASGSNAGESPTATFEPAIVQTLLPGSTPAPTQVLQPNIPPTPTPTNTPKPTNLKPKPTNPNRPTARPTNPNRPTQKPDN